MRPRGKHTRRPYIRPVRFAVPENTALIADGGLATELEARGHDLSDALWSARLLVDAPQEITAVHAAFFRAGATIATTASYQASFDGLAARGIGRDDAARLLRRSVELAKNARDDVGGAGPVGDRKRGEAGRPPDSAGWLPRWARTVPHWPTARNTADATGSALGNCGTGTDLGWRCWQTPAPTCSAWKPSPPPTRPRGWEAWSARRVSRPG